MVPRVDMCEETRNDGQRPLTTIFVRILHQQYEAISTLFTGEPTADVYTAFYPVSCFLFLWVGILPLK